MAVLSWRRPLRLECRRRPARFRLQAEIGLENPLIPPRLLPRLPRATLKSPLRVPLRASKTRVIRSVRRSLSRAPFLASRTRAIRSVQSAQSQARRRARMSLDRRFRRAPTLCLAKCRASGCLAIRSEHPSHQDSVRPQPRTNRARRSGHPSRQDLVRRRVATARRSDRFPRRNHRRSRPLELLQHQRLRQRRAGPPFLRPRERQPSPPLGRQPRRVRRCSADARRP